MYHECICGDGLTSCVDRLCSIGAYENIHNKSWNNNLIVIVFLQSLEIKSVY